MRRYSDAQILRFGVVALIVALLVTAAAFNLSKFPGFGGTLYQAEFSDASGLRVGNMVMVGGIRSGRVEEIGLDGDKVVVTFEVEGDVEFGTESEASVEVLNLLGEKYLQLTPKGEGQLDPDDRIPVERTESAYDIVGVLGDLTTTTEDIELGQLKQALDTVGSTLQSAGPELRSSFEGIARLSRTIAQRDQQLRSLLEGSAGVTQLLEERSQDIVALMRDGGKVFRELRARRDAVHRLLVNARLLSSELRGVALDNQDQIGPALDELDDLLSLLVSKEKDLKATLNAYGPYADILVNIIGTGPWFDAYVVNLAGIPTGEFVPTVGGTQ